MKFKTIIYIIFSIVINITAFQVHAATIPTHIQTIGNSTPGDFSVIVTIAPTSSSNTLIVGINSSNGLPTSVTDNKGDIFFLAASGGTGLYSAVYYAKNISAGNTTITINTPYGGTDVVVSEYSGLDLVNPLDQVQKFDNGYKTGLTFTSGSTVATSQTNELLWGFASNIITNTPPVWTAGAGWASKKTQGSSFVQDQVVSTVGSYASVGSFTSADYQIYSLIVTFKAVGSTPITPTPAPVPTPTPTPTPTLTSAPSPVPTPVPSLTPSPVSAGGPLLFFSDLDSGPNTGGENNNGVFVTLYGQNFGSNPTVTVGGGLVIVKVAPSPWMWYKKMVIQLGSNASSGKIVVTNSAGSSNPLPFTVRPGNIYCVSKPGTDTNPGTFAGGCWGTIQKSLDTMAAGDTVYVRQGIIESKPGSSNGSVSVNPGTRGTLGNPIAVIGYPGETAQIGATAKATCNSTSCTEGLFTYNNGTLYSYFTIANLTLRGNNIALSITGNSTPGALGKSTNWRVVGNDFSCPYGDGEAACVETSTSDYVSFLGNNLQNTGWSNSTSVYHGLYFSTDSNHESVGWNTIAHINGGYGIHVHSSPANGGTASDPTGYQQFDLQVHDNIVFDTQLSGMIFATIDPSKGAVNIYNNLIYRTGRGPVPPNGGGSYACLDFPAYANNGPAGGGSVEIYNNTLYDCGAQTINPAYRSGWGGALVDNGQQNGQPNLRLHITNNIIHQPSAGQIYWTMYKVEGDCSSTCNNIYGTKNVFFGVGNPGPNNELSNVNVTATLTTDPKFVNPSTNSAIADFHLQSSSPAISAGAAITGLTRDIEGTLRTPGAPDMGTYAFVAGTPPPPDTTAPSTPTNLSASAFSPSGINLAWSAATDPDNTPSQITYKIFRNTVQIAAVSGGIITYQDTGLAAATAYSYTVSASDPAGNVSAQSAAVSATTQVILPIISNLIGSNTTASTTTISWNTNVPTNGQVFYGATNAYGLQSALVDNTPKTSTHTIGLSNLTPATLHHFQVKSIDALGNATSTADFTFTTLALPPPAAPAISSFIATPSSITTGQSSTLSFTVSGTSTNLTLDQGIGSVLNQTSKIISPVTTTTYTLTASNAGGTATAQVTVTVGNIALPPTTSTPPSITSFIATPSSVTAGQAVVLSWVVTGTPAPSTAINNGIGNVMAASSKSVIPATSVTYTLTAINAVGTSTAQVMVTVNAAPISSGGGGGSWSSSGTGGSGSSGPVIVYIPPITPVVPSIASSSPAKTYSSGTLVLDQKVIYYISGTMKIPFTSMKSFLGLGYKLENVVVGDTAAYLLSSSLTINKNASSACISGTSTRLLTRNLYLSLKGEDIKILQKFLFDQKYLKTNSITGFFGPATKKAVQAFQKSQNIISSGTSISTGYGSVGPKTRIKINSMLSSSSCSR